MLKVAYMIKDAYEIRGGVDRYRVELAIALSRIKDIELDIVVLTPRSYAMSIPYRVILRESNVRYMASKSMLLKYDVIHLPDLFAAESPPISLRRFIEKTVITLHGVSPLVSVSYPTIHLYARYHQLRWLTLFRGKRLGALVTVSDSSRREISKVLRIPISKIHVVYSGVNRNIFRRIPYEEALAVLNRKFGINERYILNISSYQPIKNVEAVIYAYYVLKKLYKKKLGSRIPKLVIAGGVPQRIKLLAHRLNMEDDVLFVGFARGISLISLYNAALFLVLASLREAFSLVPIEALACGTPLALSDISSYRETIKDAAIYFNPRNPVDIAKKMYALLVNESLRRRLIDNGKRLLKRYTWNITAREYVKIYRAVANI